MDYYQSVVTDYLRADRALFLNTECCIQLNPAPNPDTSGPHWYCDAVAVDFRQEAVFLCEVSFAQGLGALQKRLLEWNAHWPGVSAAVARDCKLPTTWPVRPWVFVPEETILAAVSCIRKLSELNTKSTPMPTPRITPLEMVAPWRYTSWNREGEREKPDTIPVEMRT